MSEDKFFRNAVPDCFQLTKNFRNGVLARSVTKKTHDYRICHDNPENSDHIITECTHL